MGERARWLLPRAASSLSRRSSSARRSAHSFRVVPAGDSATAGDAATVYVADVLGIDDPAATNRSAPPPRLALDASGIRHDPYRFLRSACQPRGGAHGHRAGADEGDDPSSVAGYREQSGAGASKDALEKMFERDKQTLRGLSIQVETIGDYADPDDCGSALSYLTANTSAPISTSPRRRC